MSDKLKIISDIIDDAPEMLAVVSVPTLPVMADNFSIFRQLSIPGN